MVIAQKLSVLPCLKFTLEEVEIKFQYENINLMTRNEYMVAR